MSTNQEPIDATATPLSFDAPLDELTDAQYETWLATYEARLAAGHEADEKKAAEDAAQRKLERARSIAQYKAEREAIATAAGHNNYISDLGLCLSNGTPLPLAFCTQNIKVVLGQLTDGRLAHPAFRKLHTRRYAFNIAEPSTGKGETYKRVFQACESLLAFFQVKVIQGAMLGSGQFMAKQLVQNPNAIVAFDEGKALFETSVTLGSTLETTFLNLFEDNVAAYGSNKNGHGTADNVHLSVTGGFTEESFESSFTGRGSRGSGFLSRVELAYGEPTKYNGDWLETDINRLSEIMATLRAKVEALPLAVNGPLVLEETDEAKRIRLDFENVWLLEQPSDFGKRIAAHTKRDAVLRAYFSNDGKITAEHARAAVAWGKNQVALREKLWVNDRGSQSETMERKIFDQLKKHGRLTHTRLADHCKVRRSGSGGFKMFNAAIFALRDAHQIKVTGKTQRNVPIFELDLSDE